LPPGKKERKSKNVTEGLKNEGLKNEKRELASRGGKR